ncbi:D-ribose pyranase [candidate division KSB1 bacterium]|nr:D-ribose pyranase [candidate division KSB1 bacterium]
MKKSGILNSKLAELVAKAGHGDQLIVSDCGLPIPGHAVVVDLAVTTNIPRFIDTVKVILEELHVESAIIATEMESISPELYKELKLILPDIQIKKVNHEKFKELTMSDKNIGFVRTGEATSYANIILISGVTF